jgi:hypothetical protein
MKLSIRAYLKIPKNITACTFSYFKKKKLRHTLKERITKPSHGFFFLSYLTSQRELKTYIQLNIKPNKKIDKMEWRENHNIKPNISFYFRIES